MGLEPIRAKCSRHFKCRVSTNSTTPTEKQKYLCIFVGGLSGNRTRACEFCRLMCYHFTIRPVLYLRRNAYSNKTFKIRFLLFSISLRSIKKISSLCSEPDETQSSLCFIHFTIRPFHYLLILAHNLIDTLTITFAVINLKIDVRNTFKRTSFRFDKAT